MNILTNLLALGIFLTGSSMGQETKTYPDGTKYQTPSFTKAGPDSNLLDDQFIIGTGSFAPDGGLLLPREKVYEHINKSTPISTNNQTNYNNQSNSSTPTITTFDKSFDKLKAINLANMTFLVFPLPEYDMTERILWVNSKPYGIFFVIHE